MPKKGEGNGPEKLPLPRGESQLPPDIRIDEEGDADDLSPEALRELDQAEKVMREALSGPAPVPDKSREEMPIHRLPELPEPEEITADIASVKPEAGETAPDQTAPDITAPTIGLPELTAATMPQPQIIDRPTTNIPESETFVPAPEDTLDISTPQQRLELAELVNQLIKLDKNNEKAYQNAAALALAHPDQLDASIATFKETLAALKKPRERDIKTTLVRRRGAVPLSERQTQTDRPAFVPERPTTPPVPATGPSEPTRPAVPEKKKHWWQFWKK